MLMLNIYVYYISLETPLTLLSIHFLFPSFLLSSIHSLAHFLFLYCYVLTFVYVIVHCHHSFRAVPSCCTV